MYNHINAVATVRKKSVKADAMAVAVETDAIEVAVEADAIGVAVEADAIAGAIEADAAIAVGMWFCRKDPGPEDNDVFGV